MNTLLILLNRTCSADETWTGEETDCVAVKCEAINSPANGNMVCSKKRDFGSVCTINCDSGFDLVGPRQRACGAEGRWSGLPPSCQLIHCGPLTGKISLCIQTLNIKQPHNMATSHVLHWTSSALSVTTIVTLATSWLDQIHASVKNQVHGLVYNPSVNLFNVVHLRRLRMALLPVQGTSNNDQPNV